MSDTVQGSGLNLERIARFDAYRETLTEIERAELDGLLASLCNAIKGKAGREFGPKSGKELIVALVDYLGRGRP